MTNDERCRDGTRSWARRRLLGRAASVAVAVTMLGSLASCVSLGPTPPRNRDPGADAALLDNLIGLQNEAVAAYEFVRAGGALGGAERAQAAAFAEDHRKHAEALTRLIDRLGGKTSVEAKRDYGFASGAVARRDDAIDFLIGIEQGLTLAHLAAVPAFAGRALAKDVAAMLGVAAMHWASWRRALGQDPVPAPFLT
jgi:hypothetical protein